MTRVRRWIPIVALILSFAVGSAVAGDRVGRRAQAPPGGGRNSQIEREAATVGAPGGQPGVNQQPTSGGGVVEANRNYAVEIAIVVVLMGGALWAVCKSARRV